MAKHNAANVRIKRAYLQYLKEAKRLDEASVDAAARAISQFEGSTRYRDFKTFRIEQAVSFKRRLCEQISERTGKPLSRATVHSTLSALRAFFIWLADKPGYKSRLSYSDADYFNLGDKEVRIAQAKRSRPAPTLQQIHYVLSKMPAETDIERRNRALIAFAILTGARDGALASFKLKHIDLADARVDQDARDVKTKGSKTFKTWFYRVGGCAEEIFRDWCAHLREQLHWGDDDALFPATRLGTGEGGGFVAVGLHRHGWHSAAPIREIFRAAFGAAGLPYFHPHSFRSTLTQLGERICPTQEAFKSWSQNLGHEHVQTTLTSYGTVPPERQAELIRSLGGRTTAIPMELLEQAEPEQLLAVLAKKVGNGGARL